MASVRLQPGLRSRHTPPPNVIHNTRQFSKSFNTHEIHADKISPGSGKSMRFKHHDLCYWQQKNNAETKTLLTKKNIIMKTASPQLSLTADPNSRTGHINPNNKQYTSKQTCDKGTTTRWYFTTIFPPFSNRAKFHSLWLIFACHFHVKSIFVPIDSFLNTYMHRFSSAVLTHNTTYSF